MTAHYREHRCRQQFSRVLEQLNFELSMGSARRHLDHLIDHLETILMLLGETVLRESLVKQLAEAKQRVAQRHNLRLVKGPPHV